MNLSTIKTAVTRTAGRTALLGKQYSPEILTIAGLAGGVVAAVLAAKATLKLESVHTEFEDKVASLKNLKEFKDRGLGDPEQEYTDGEYRRDLAKTYVVGLGGYAKLYGPSITLAVVSAACILGGHYIIRKRLVGTLAAYKVLEESFSQYRARVVEEFGEEKDLEYRLNLRAVDQIGDDGKKTGQKVLQANPNDISGYARFFDELNQNWEPNAEYNLIWLRGQEAYFNNLLQARGHVFLNDVYDVLGFERSGAGSQVGWVVGMDGMDNHIDFGMYNPNNVMAREFVNGNERSVLLDFNVDGIISDKIDYLGRTRA